MKKNTNLITKRAHGLRNLKANLEISINLDRTKLID